MVDPVEPAKVMTAVDSLGCTVKYILTTHNHWDHAGGNEEMSNLVPDAPVVAGENDGVPSCTLPVSHGQILALGKSSILVLDTPCHTPGHVCYYVRSEESQEAGAVFTGDTLFLGGCGNLNSGTPAQLHHALLNVLGSLPDETQVYYGHNYNEKNLRWAQHVEPTNAAVAAKLQETRDNNARSEFTHSTIGGEKSYNPFMRVELPSMQEWADCSGDAVATLLKVRQGKDVWGRSN